MRRNTRCKSATPRFWARKWSTKRDSSSSAKPTISCPLGLGPTIEVQGFFTSGENSEGLVRTTQDNYELQNYTSDHAWQPPDQIWGQAARALRRRNRRTRISMVRSFFLRLAETLLRRCRLTQNAARGKLSVRASYSPQNCPSQFSITTGTPNVSVGWFDAGLYAEDEWRAKPNLSLTYGLRFESQNNIHDHADFAPRLGVAWGLGSNGKSAPKTVLRAGFGIFYDRFGYNLVQEADLLNGVTQPKVTIRNPDFYSNQRLAASAVQPTRQPGRRFADDVSNFARTCVLPTQCRAAASIERQVTKNATVSVTYLNSRGEHAFYIDNINAPYVPGGITPNGTSQNIYQYDSGGIFRQNQLIANVRVNTGRRVSLFGFYVLNYANSDASSGGSAGGFFSSGTTSEASFLSNQYDPLADYGRAAFDVRHRVFVGRQFLFALLIFAEPVCHHQFRASPTTSRPVRTTTGTRFLTTAHGSRAARPTQFAPRERLFRRLDNGARSVPVNYCTGPSDATLNLRLSKTIGFGPETKGASSGGDRGYGGPHGHGGGLGPGRPERSRRK